MERLMEPEKLTKKQFVIELESANKFNAMEARNRKIKRALAANAFLNSFIGDRQDLTNEN